MHDTEKERERRGGHPRSDAGCEERLISAMYKIHFHEATLALAGEGENEEIRRLRKTPAD